MKPVHPNTDHSIPALYIDGLVDAQDDLAFFNTGIDADSLSMRRSIYA
ncbi:MAG: hypothetical protein HRU31_09215 [Rhodobacteraceae bacterium]|nr:hypothetical protein [Paracoccaceae bacterium]